MKLTKYYVTFGGIFFGYHLRVEAYSKDIVRAWMNWKGYQKCWSAVYDKEPKTSKPLREEPELLFYEKASHVA